MDKSKLIKAAKRLFTSVSDLQDCVGCGCGGDFGICGVCEKINKIAEDARIGWIEAENLLKKRKQSE